MTQQIKYKRVLLKLSGESLMGSDPFGINHDTIVQPGGEIAEVVKMGVQVGIVVGGGNIFRGVSAQAGSMDRATADYMGMMATVMNALALKDAFETLGIKARVQSAPRNAAAVSVVKNGLPVPAAKITTLPSSKY